MRSRPWLRAGSGRRRAYRIYRFTEKQGRLETCLTTRNRRRLVMRLVTRFHIIVPGAALALATLAWTQSFAGGVRGTVFDAGGGAVNEVTLSLTDEAAGTHRSTLSSGDGSYNFSQVVPATYTITAEAPGFKRVERKHVIVATQEFVSLDLKLEVGAVSESIQVTAEVPLIESA